jgi:hypothetical protein
MKPSCGLHGRSIVRPRRSAENFVKEKTMTAFHLHQFDPKNLPSGRPGTTEMGNLATLIEEIVKTGLPRAGGTVQPVANRGHGSPLIDRAAGIRGRRRGKLTITDGPFTETKELIAGAVC